MRQAEGPRQALWQRRGPHHFVAAVPGLQVGLAGAPDDDGRVLRLLAEAVVHVGHRAVHVRCARRPSRPSVPQRAESITRAGSTTSRVIAAPTCKKVQRASRASAQRGSCGGGDALARRPPAAGREHDQQCPCSSRKQARRCSARQGPALSAGAAARAAHWPVGLPRQAERTNSKVSATPISKQKGALRIAAHNKQARQCSAHQGPVLSAGAATGAAHWPGST